MNDYLDAIEQHIAAIPAPKFDFAAVQKRADGKPAHRPRRNVIAGILLMIAAPIVAVAAAHFVPLQVTHRFGNWQLYGPDRGETLLHPTSAMFSRVARQAPYPVVWPSGLPRQHKPFMLGGVGSEVFTVVYSCAGQRIDRASSVAVIIPKNYAAVNPKLGKWFTSQIQDHRQNALWDVGGESIMLGSDCLTQQQIARIREATIARGGSRKH